MRCLGFELGVSFIFIPFFYRLPYRNSRSQSRQEDIESRIGAPNGENLQPDSSLSGDLSSLAASSRADAVTIRSLPLDISGM